MRCVRCDEERLATVAAKASGEIYVDDDEDDGDKGGT